MNRLALILELIGAGFTPPPTIPNDALFDCVDSVRRKAAGEKTGLLCFPPDLIVIEDPERGAVRLRMPEGFTKAHAPGPVLDVWPGQVAAIARGLFALA